MFEAKFMLPWSFSEEAAVEKCMPQPQHNRAAVGWGVRELAKKPALPPIPSRVSKTGRMRSNRQWTGFGAPWKRPGSSSPMVSSLASGWPRPPQCTHQNPPGLQIRRSPRRQPAAKPPRRPRRSDSLRHVPRAVLRRWFEWASSSSKRTRQAKCAVTHKPPGYRLTGG